MDYCAICGCDITELGSNRCIGFACENRLCFKCFSDTGGYCSRCKILRELETVQMQPGAMDISDELYEELAEIPERDEQLWEEVKRRREKEKEERIREEEEKQRMKEEEFEKDESTEAFILKRLRELNEEDEEF